MLFKLLHFISKVCRTINWKNAEETLINEGTRCLVVDTNKCIKEIKVYMYFPHDFVLTNLYYT